MTGDGAPCDAMKGDGQSPELNVTALCSKPRSLALEAQALCLAISPAAGSAGRAAASRARLRPSSPRASPDPRTPCAAQALRASKKAARVARLSRHRLWPAGRRRVAVSASRRQGWLGVRAGSATIRRNARLDQVGSQTVRRRRGAAFKAAGNPLRQSGFTR